jgi:hypothetical protein
VQTHEVTDRNCIEGRGHRGELAQDSKAHRYGAYGKCSASVRKHRVLTWGDLCRKRRVCLTDITGWVPPGNKTWRRGELPAA